MSKTFSKFSFNLLVVLSINLYACSDGFDKEDYKKEAEAVCDVYNPVHWKNLPTDIEPEELAELLSQRLSSALKSEEMAEIFRTIGKADPDMRYKYYVERVSILIGEKYECSYIKEYLTF